MDVDRSRSRAEAAQLQPEAPHDDVVLLDPGYGGQQEPSPPRQASLPWLFFSVVGGLAAYMAHLVFTFWFLVTVCGPTDRVVAGAATALAALVAGAATWAGGRAWRALRANEQERRREAERQAKQETELERQGAQEGERRSTRLPLPRWVGWLLLAAGVVRELRRPRRPAPRYAQGWDPAPEARVRSLLAVAGTGLSALSLVILLLVGVSVLVVPSCV